MGRKRTIDREATMAAIEQVVRQSGIAGLSIDAVAREAGISKSSVIYDFETKAAMLAAFTRSKFETHRQQQEEITAGLPDGADKWLRGLLACAGECASEDDVTAALIISAGVASHDECRQVMREYVTDDLDRIRAESTDEDAALVAYLAFFGLMSMEHFGFHDVTPEFRTRCLDAVMSKLVRPAICGATARPADTLASEGSP